MCYRDNFIYRIYCSVKQCNIKILLWLKHFYDSWRIDEQMHKPRSIQKNNKEKEKQIGKQRDKSINPCHFHSVVKFFHFDPYNVCTYPTLFVSPHLLKCESLISPQKISTFILSSGMLEGWMHLTKRINFK